MAGVFIKIKTHRNIRKWINFKTDGGKRGKESKYNPVYSHNSAINQTVLYGNKALQVWIIKINIS